MILALRQIAPGQRLILNVMPAKTGTHDAAGWLGDAVSLRRQNEMQMNRLC